MPPAGAGVPLRATSTGEVCATEGVAPTREEPGCLSVHAFRSIRDPQRFYIHSRWKDVEAFEHHASLPHTVRLLERVEPLIDHPLDVNRTEQIF